MAEQNTNSVQFTDEELDQIKSLQTGYQEKVLQFGQLNVERLLTEQRLDELDKLEKSLQSEYENLQKQEQEIVTSLNEKYGPGQLNPSSGVFTPATETDTENS